MSTTTFNITTKPVTTTVVVVELDEAQARAVLVDPTDFQDQLRAALAPLGAGRANVNHHGRGHAKRPKERKAIERVPCETCGMSIPAYRQGKHKCPVPGARS